MASWIFVFVLGLFGLITGSLQADLGGYQLLQRPGVERSASPFTSFKRRATSNVKYQQKPADVNLEGQTKGSLQMEITLVSEEKESMKNNAYKNLDTEIKDLEESITRDILKLLSHRSDLNDDSNLNTQVQTPQVVSINGYQSNVVDTKNSDSLFNSNQQNSHGQSYSAIQNPYAPKYGNNHTKSQPDGKQAGFGLDYGFVDEYATDADFVYDYQDVHGYDPQHEEFYNTRKHSAVEEPVYEKGQIIGYNNNKGSRNNNALRGPKPGFVHGGNIHNGAHRRPPTVQRIPPPPVQRIPPPIQKKEVHKLALDPHSEKSISTDIAALAAAQATLATASNNLNSQCKARGGSCVSPGSCSSNVGTFLCSQSQICCLPIQVVTVKKVVIPQREQSQILGYRPPQVSQQQPPPQTPFHPVQLQSSQQPQTTQQVNIISNPQQIRVPFPNSVTYQSLQTGTQLQQNPVLSSPQISQQQNQSPPPNRNTVQYQQPPNQNQPQYQPLPNQNQLQYQSPPNQNQPQYQSQPIQNQPLYQTQPIQNQQQYQSQPNQNLPQNQAPLNQNQQRYQTQPIQNQQQYQPQSNQNQQQNQAPLNQNQQRYQTQPIQNQQQYQPQSNQNQPQNQAPLNQNQQRYQTQPIQNQQQYQPQSNQNQPQNQAPPNQNQQRYQTQSIQNQQQRPSNQYQPQYQQQPNQNQQQYQPPSNQNQPQYQSTTNQQQYQQTSYQQNENYQNQNVQNTQFNQQAYQQNINQAPPTRIKYQPRPQPVQPEQQGINNPTFPNTQNNRVHNPYLPHQHQFEAAINEVLNNRHRVHPALNLYNAQQEIYDLPQPTTPPPTPPRYPDSYYSFQDYSYSKPSSIPSAENGYRQSQFHGQSATLPGVQLPWVPSSKDQVQEKHSEKKLVLTIDILDNDSNRDNLDIISKKYLGQAK